VIYTQNKIARGLVGGNNNIFFMEEGEMFSNICVGFYKYRWRVSKALDFSILYTTNPNTLLKSRIKELIQRCFSKKSTGI
jgi:hypothetical protein